MVSNNSAWGISRCCTFIERLTVESELLTVNIFAASFAASCADTFPLESASRLLRETFFRSSSDIILVCALAIEIEAVKKSNMR